MPYVHYKEPTRTPAANSWILLWLHVHSTRRIFIETDRHNSSHILYVDNTEL